MGSLTDSLRKMKTTYEDAILKGRYTELIRSKVLIEILHDFAVQELTKKLPADWVYRDKPAYGFPKTKTQDILVQPPQDPAKSLSVGPLLTVNVRSQLSSIDKNFDTLFERLFAEALNLHNRFPYLVLGYLYLLPKIGYSDSSAAERKVEFKERYNVAKYIQSFLSITDRKGPNDVPWRYERICLLIVDFQKDPPAVLNDTRVFMREGLVSKDFASHFSFATLSMGKFFDELYRIAMERYYSLLTSS
jgi:hypothetical protein